MSSYLRPPQPVLYVTSDPDGVVSAQKGTLAIDTTTGVTWKNRSGSTRWDPVDIPPTRGHSAFLDFDDSLWTATATGGGSGSFVSPASSTQVGVRRLSASAAGVDAYTIMIANTNTMSLGSGRYVFRGSVAITTLSDGTNRAIYRVGGGDIAGLTDHVDGVYLESDLAGNGSNNWFLCTANNSIRTKTDTGIVPVADTYQHLEIRVNADGTSVSAEINGVAAASAVTTNIPTTVGRTFSPFLATVIKSLGATARTFDVDWISYYSVLTAART